MRALMWFRADLRVGDNPALTRACAESDDGVVAVFTVCPRQWRGAHGWGDARVEYLLATLGALRVRLAALNIPLKIVETADFAGVPGALVGLAQETGCDRLFFNREYEWNERLRDEAVVDAFEEAGTGCGAFCDQVLYEPGSILTKGAGTFYTVYSPFKRACWARFNDEGAWDVLGVPGAADRIDIESDAVPETVAGFGASGVDLSVWPIGEDAAIERLRAFADSRLFGYKDARDFPAKDETSRLSAPLAVGSVSAKQCMAAALEANGGRIDSGDPGAVCWMQEILWREFYRHVLVGFPRVSRDGNFNAAYNGLPWREAPDELEAWKRGRTGYPIVDAAMRCLLETGWMHNRLRMVVAMFLTKHLLIDWREGERHFMRHLIDGDLASNNGGWQWSASTGTDAQPYFRIFNPISQGKKFDPDGSFVRRWVPELAGVEGDAVHEPREAGLLVDTAGDAGYPPAMVDQKAGRTRAIEVFKAHRGG